MSEAVALDALRVLLGADADGARRLAAIEPDALTRLARANVVTVRLDEAMRKAGAEPPAALILAAKRERVRIAEAWRIIARIDEVCRANGVVAAFPKATQHEPDMGHDVDVLAMAPAARIDETILATLDARRDEPSPSNRVAGKTSARPNGAATPIEIHHARLGLVGEHARLARLLVEHARPRAAPPRVLLPAPEEALLLQAAQRVCGHRSLRLGDVLATRDLLAGPLDLARVADASRETGLRRALSLHVGALGEVLARSGSALGASAEPLHSARAKLAFDGAVFRFSNEQVVGAYASKAWADATRGRAASAARVAMLPAVAAWTIGARRFRGER